MAMVGSLVSPREAQPSSITVVIASAAAFGSRARMASVIAQW